MECMFEQAGNIDGRMPFEELKHVNNFRNPETVVEGNLGMDMDIRQRVSAA